MENILLAVDGTKLNANTLDFACYIANLTHSRLTAVFIENIVGQQAPQLKELFALPYVESISSADFPENTRKEKCCDINEGIFRQACANRGINCFIKREKHVVIGDVISESRFADMIIIDPETSFDNKTEGTPTRFTKEILAVAECPVIIAPYSFDGIKEIAFAYDGSKSAVFAIKEFVHLFPALSNYNLTVLQVSEQKIMPFKGEDKIQELLSAHFSNISYQHLQGKPADELFGYLLNKKNVFVVMGAYGRGILSNLFSHSTADLVIKTINLPIFIAHR